MLKMQIIGYLGKDAVVQAYDSKTVINFTVAHSEKYTDAAGVKFEKTIWVSCAWWIDKTTIAQYLKKGTQIYAEGIPEARMWDSPEGKKCGLNLRIFNLNLLGGKKEDTSNAQQAAQPTSSPAPQTGFVPYGGGDPGEPIGVDDLPF